MANVTEAKTTVEVKKVVEDAAEGVTIGAILSLLWKLAEPHLIEVGVGVKKRVKEEYTLNLGSVGRDIVLMEPAKRTKLLARLQRAIDEETDTHFMSMLSKFPPDDKGSRRDLLEGLADMSDEEFNATLKTQDDKIAQWIHLVRKDGRHMLQRDLGFIAGGAKVTAKAIGSLAKKVDGAAEELAPRLRGIAQSLRNRRMGKQNPTGSSSTHAASGTGGSKRTEGEWKW